MKRFLTNMRFFLLIIPGLLFTTCEKQEYDVFPLNVGNEYYFTYYKYHIPAYTNGTERWKVISVTSQGGSDIYTIERKLNAVLKIGGQTIIIADSIRLFNISEEKSSSLLSTSSMFLFIDLNFKRYQSNPVLEIKKDGTANASSWSWTFKADSGLTKYSYYHPPNQIVNETLHLDSLKIHD